MAQKWLVPYRRNRKNYEDIGLLPLALEHDTGFSGDKLYRVVKQSPPGSLYFSSTGLPLFRKRLEAIRAAKELVREGNPTRTDIARIDWADGGKYAYGTRFEAKATVWDGARYIVKRFKADTQEQLKKDLIAAGLRVVRMKKWSFNVYYTPKFLENPAVSASQYGMAQAVLSGASKGMPKKAARELVERTPARERSRFARELAGRREARGNPEYEYYSSYDSLAEAREKAKRLSVSANVYTKIVKQAEGIYEVWTVTKPRKRAGRAGAETREKNAGPPAWFSDSMSLGEFSEQFRRRSSLKFSNEQLRETWNDWKLAARRRREREESLERFYAREGNPSPSFDSAAALSTSFHGREPEEIEEVIESEEYRTDLAHLGDLVELTLITPDGKYEQTIEFEYQNGDEVSLASSPEGNQYYFEGGDQHIDLEEMDWLSDEERKKDKVLLGPVLRIAYYADKHHLEGGKKQKDGCEYEHEFGEETGNLPELIYDRLNEKLELVGGSYKTEDVGIRD